MREILVTPTKVARLLPQKARNKRVRTYGEAKWLFRSIMAISKPCYVTKGKGFEIPCLVMDLYNMRKNKEETLYEYIKRLLDETNVQYNETTEKEKDLITFPEKKTRGQKEVNVSYVRNKEEHDANLIIQNFDCFCWSAAAFSFLYQTKLYERLVGKRENDIWFLLQVLTRSQELEYCSSSRSNNVVPQTSTGYTFQQYWEDAKKYWDDFNQSDILQRDYAAPNQYGVDLVTAILKCNGIPHVALRLECDMPFKTLYNDVTMTLTHPENLSKYTNVGCIAIVIEPGKTDDKHYLCIVPQPYVHIDRVSIIDPNDDKIVTQKPKWRYWTARVTHVTWILVETDPVRKNLSAELGDAAD